ncbi:hypothetical protein QUF54_07945 [Candidatus Marithioploca araucensis]|uniref:Uncharacterized protein n=1 Tax=Candidatus Marithioploca araucensis TaxID=70273 RepID=A0ABT7VUK9_9GAMM|nr:hypothetical protein [Candidatus Marithioploca araucensis]
MVNGELSFIIFIIHQRFLQNSYDEGRHAGMPLQNFTSFMAVGANLRVRPRFHP